MLLSISFPSDRPADLLTGRGADLYARNGSGGLVLLFATPFGCPNLVPVLRCVADGYGRLGPGFAK
ncbi:hypothetical protein [Hymenobacter algoricola]|uniref:hypothetical protein n=1 Tax=Hymenobacter algoricola TaxID=486267 RepID=UPI0031E60997